MNTQDCQFFYKIGSCRHGAKCIRKHTVTLSARAIVLENILAPIPLNEREQAIKDIFLEIALISPIKTILVASNQSPHLLGSIYVQFQTTEHAKKVYTNFNKRWYAYKPIFAKYVPSNTITTSVCRENDQCQRQANCNYVHPLKLDPEFWKYLFTAQIANNN